MPRTYVFRLTAEGVRELESEFRSLGDVGDRAFDSLQRKIPGLGGALDDANRKLDEVRRRMSDQSLASERVNAGPGAISGRYTTGAAVVGLGSRAMREAAEVNEDVANSLKQINAAWEDFALTISKPLAPVAAGLAQAADAINDIWELLTK